MPAGDLVVADYQLELRGVLMGAGTVYGIGPRPASIEGLGNPQPKTADLDFAHADGAYGGQDKRGVRVVTVPIVIRQTTAALAMTSLETLMTAWDVSAADIPLYFRLPGWGRRYVNGRPRGLAADIPTELKQRFAIACLGTFVCPTPTILT